MKLDKATSAVEISGAQSTPQVFNIQASKAAFSVLSSGLYTNKVRAIIRELSCNAYDSHVDAGKAEVPFALHLPTTFEPFFSVKDQGTGLRYTPGGCLHCKGTGNLEELDCTHCRGTGDYDAVQELYCSYFGTSRNNSNLFIGALGLGSKSPFCYTEGFSVTNVYGGKKRIYSCFIDAKGLPSVLLQAESDTDEANGVEVNFPVRQRDIWEFENQASYALEFFRPRPEINLPYLVIKSATYTLRTDTWGLRDGEGAPRAIQGRVQYSIGEIDESRLSVDAQDLVDQPFDLFFPIGELSVAASRESLSNDEQTVANIVSALENIKKGLIADLKAKVALCKSPWEARLLLFIASNADGLGDLVKRAYRSGEFNTANPRFLIGQGEAKLTRMDYPAVAVHEFTRTRFVREYANKLNLTPNDKENKPLPGNFSITAEDVTLFVINDIGYGTDKYIHHMLQQDSENETKTVYLLTKANKDAKLEQVFEQGTRLIEAAGNPPVVLLSALREKYAETFRNTEAKPSAPARTILQFNESYRHAYDVSGWRSSRGWNDVTNTELPQGVKFYVPLKNLVPQTGWFRDHGHMKGFIQMVRACKPMGFEGKALYGIPFYKVDKLDKKEWVEFTAYAKRKYKTLLTPKRRTQISLHRQGFNSGMNPALLALAKRTDMDADSALFQFSMKWAEASLYDRSEITAILELHGSLGANASGDLLAEKHPVTFSSLWEEILSSYPMLNYVSVLGTGKTSLEILVDYVKMVDRGLSGPGPVDSSPLDFGQTFAVPAPAGEFEEVSYAEN